MSLGNHRDLWWAIPSIIAVALWACPPAWGLNIISKGSGGEGREVPVHVTAERMEVDNATNLIRFSGNVVSVRGDMVIRSDTLEVLNAGGGGSGEEQVKKIVARGNVQFENATKKATGDQAVYSADERTVVLSGNARAWEGENVVSGSRMTIYIDEDKTVVEGGADQRVEVDIISTNKENSGLLAVEKGKGQTADGKESPIHVTADRMETDQKQKTVFFEGKVKTRRDDFNMDSDELEVFDSGKEASRISKIIARGNVRLDRAGKVATGDKAIYYEGERKFLLTGNAKAWEDQNVVAGSRMEIYLDEDKSVVLGDGNEQVEVTIYPKEKQSSKELLPPPTVSAESKPLN